MTATAYRVEHAETGEGPYNGIYWDYQDDMAFAHSAWTHPSPMRDPALRHAFVSHRQVCGTISADTLFNWFKGFWAGLARAGFVVRVYVGTDAVVGHNGQVIFTRDQPATMEVDAMEFATQYAAADLPPMESMTPNWD